MLVSAGQSYRALPHDVLILFNNHVHERESLSQIIMERPKLCPVRVVWNRPDLVKGFSPKTNLTRFYSRNANATWLLTVLWLLRLTTHKRVIWSHRYEIFHQVLQIASCASRGWLTPTEDIYLLDSELEVAWWEKVGLCIETRYNRWPRAILQREKVYRWDLKAWNDPSLAVASDAEPQCRACGSLDGSSYFGYRQMPARFLSTNLNPVASIAEQTENGLV